MADRLTAINVTRGVQVTDHARVADNAWTKLIGLLRDQSLEPGDGIWLKPCNSIHSFGMKFVFDAIFLDKKLRVVHLMNEMKPGRISRIVFSAQSVLEIPAGVIRQSGTELGDEFEMRRKKL
ncbi:MAG TPA: DUF192 domain-containing protein [Candidatus Methylacidiphilales bacterium]|nr:DUF192 domain-containing protein [Candidatus Methylacidiphilales bacterium]